MVGLGLGIGLRRRKGVASSFPSIITASDGVSMRWIERDGYLCIDLTVLGSALGFSGVQGVDWYEESSSVSLYWTISFLDSSRWSDSRSWMDI